MFTIDGLTWDVPCSIERTSEMTASDISGLMLDKSYFNDVLGTYMKYSIKIVVPFDMRDEFNAIYEAITSPVDGHTMVLPYNGSTITITARIVSISDVYVRLAGGETYWKGITFEAISNYPSKTMELDEVIAAGRTPMPDVAEPSIGDTYTWDGDEWVPAQTYTDADNIAY